MTFIDPIGDINLRCVKTLVTFKSLQINEIEFYLDVDDEEIGRNYPATVGINAEAKVALDLLYPIVESLVPRKNSRHEEVSEHREKISLQFTSVEQQASFLTAIR